MAICWKYAGEQTASIIVGTTDLVNLVDSLAGTMPARHMALGLGTKRLNTFVCVHVCTSRLDGERSSNHECLNHCANKGYAQCICHGN